MGGEYSLIDMPPRARFPISSTTSGLSAQPSLKRAEEDFYRPPTKSREGNVFTGVCLSSEGGGGGDSISDARFLPGSWSHVLFRAGYLWPMLILAVGIPNPHRYSLPDNLPLNH